MDFTLRVAPDELKRKASEFSAMITNIENRFERIQETSLRTGGYWLGEAGDLNREGYASHRENMDEVLNRLKEHPVTLLKLANLYDPMERENAEIAASLPTDTLA